MTRSEGAERLAGVMGVVEAELGDMFEHDLHAKRVKSLVGAAIGALTVGRLGVHAIGIGLAEGAPLFIYTLTLSLGFLSASRVKNGTRFGSGTVRRGGAGRFVQSGSRLRVSLWSDLVRPSSLQIECRTRTRLAASPLQRLHAKCRLRSRCFRAGSEENHLQSKQSRLVWLDQAVSRPKRPWRRNVWLPP
jgi:hypothetical protein